MSLRDSTPVTTERITDIAERTYGAISRPLRGASLFYALYYLVELEGVQEAAFDFKQLREEYYDAFWWYGIFSILNEFTHVLASYYVRGAEVANYLEGREIRVPKPADERDSPNDWRTIEASPADLVPHVESLITPGAVDGTRFDVDDIEALAVALFQGADQLGAAGTYGVPGDESNVRNMLLAADRLYPSFLSDPEALVVAIGEIFENSTTVGAYIASQPTPVGFTDEQIEEDFGRPVRRQVFEANGWTSTNYNGPGWTGITRHLLRRDDLSATAWVDQSWSIEHNTGIWLNKVRLAESEMELVEAEGEGLTTYDVLRDVLDAAHEGDMDVIFDWAVRYSDTVDVNLRRMRTVFGL